MGLEESITKCKNYSLANKNERYCLGKEISRAREEYNLSWNKLGEAYSVSGTTARNLVNEYSEKLIEENKPGVLRKLRTSLTQNYRVAAGIAALGLLFLVSLIPNCKCDPYEYNPKQQTPIKQELPEEIVKQREEPKYVEIDLEEKATKRVIRKYGISGLYEVCGGNRNDIKGLKKFVTEVKKYNPKVKFKDKNGDGLPDSWYAKSLKVCKECVDGIKRLKAEKKKLQEIPGKRLGVSPIKDKHLPAEYNQNDEMAKKIWDYEVGIVDRYLTGEKLSKRELERVGEAEEILRSGVKVILTSNGILAKMSNWYKEKKELMEEPVSEIKVPSKEKTKPSSGKGLDEKVKNHVVETIKSEGLEGVAEQAPPYVPETRGPANLESSTKDLVEQSYQTGSEENGQREKRYKVKTVLPSSGTQKEKAVDDVTNEIVRKACIEIIQRHFNIKIKTHPNLVGRKVNVNGFVDENGNVHIRTINDLGTFDDDVKKEIEGRVIVPKGGDSGRFNFSHILPE